MTPIKTYGFGLLGPCGFAYTVESSVPIYPIVTADFNRRGDEGILIDTSFAVQVGGVVAVHDEEAGCSVRAEVVRSFPCEAIPQWETLCRIPGR